MKNEKCGSREKNKCYRREINLPSRLFCPMIKPALVNVLLVRRNLRIDNSDLVLWLCLKVQGSCISKKMTLHCRICFTCKSTILLHKEREGFTISNKLFTCKSTKYTRMPFRTQFCTCKSPITILFKSPIIIL